MRCNHDRVAAISINDQLSRTRSTARGSAVMSPIDKKTNAVEPNTVEPGKRDRALADGAQSFLAASGQ